MKYIYLIWLVIFASPLAWAEFEPKDVPPLRAVELFSTNEAESVYYLLAKDAKSGNTFLLISEDGQVRIPELKKNSMEYYDGGFTQRGSSDLYLETGERVMLPTGHSKNYLKTTLGPTIMYPDKAPTYLTSVKATNAFLETLGFSTFLEGSIDYKKKPSKTERNYSPMQKTDNLDILVVTLPKDLDYEDNRKFLEKLTNYANELDPTGIRIVSDSSDFFGENNHILLVRKKYVSQLEAFISKQYSSRFEYLYPKADLLKSRSVGSSAELVDVIKRLNTKGISFRDPVIDLITVSESTHLFSSLSDSEKAELVKGIHLSLWNLEVIFTSVRKHILYDVAYSDFYEKGKEGMTYTVGGLKNFKNSKSHTLRKDVLQPLQLIAREVYRALDKIDHPDAREYVVIQSDKFDGANLNMLTKKASGAEESYFDVWLTQLRQELSLAHSLPEEVSFKALEKAKLGIGSHSGGHFENFFVRTDLFYIQDYSDKVLYFDERDRTKMLPRFILGTPGDKAFIKQKLVQLIIDADKTSDPLVAWMRELNANERQSFDESTQKLEGNRLIVDIIDRLALAPRLSGLDAVGFNEKVYYKNVTELFIELIELSSYSIKSKEANLALLNASIDVVDRVNEVRGGRPSKSAFKLQTLVQQRLVRRSDWKKMPRPKRTRTCSSIFKP